MSDQDKTNRKSRTGSGPHSRPGGQGAGRSGRASSIGAELGELDFEPDALLDSLFEETADEDAEPTISAEKPLIPAVPNSPKIVIPTERMYPADEVTRVNRPEQLQPVAPASDDVDALLEESAAAVPEPEALPPTPRPPPPPQPLKAPPAPPRPAASVSRPVPPRPPTWIASSKTTAIGLNPPPPPVAPPRPGNAPPAAAKAPVPKTAVDLESELESLDEFDEAVVESGMPTMPHIEPEAQETIADALESLRDSESDERETPPPIVPAPLIQPRQDSFTSLHEEDFEEISGEVRPEQEAIPVPEPEPLPRAVVTETRESLVDEDEHAEIEELLKMEAAPVPEPRAARAPAPAPLAFGPSGEDRSAATHLAEHGVRDAWLSRAEWLEAEAQAIADPRAKARALAVASELWAMVGETSRAREVAAEAGAAAPSLPLIQRQLRSLAAAEGDWRAVAAALESEAKTSPSPESRAHAAYMSSEVHRLQLGDDASAQRKLDVAIRTQPGDARAHVMKVSQLLAKSAAAPRVRWPEVSALAPLIDVVEELVRLRGGSVEPTQAVGAVGFEEARRALASGDSAAAGQRIASLSGIAGLEDGARWLAAALLAPSAATRPQAIELTAQLLERAGGRLARRALAARALEQGDAAAVARALDAAPASGGSDEPFAAADRVALSVLTARDADKPGDLIEQLGGDEAARPLLVAALSAAAPPEEAAPFTIGSPAAQSAVALGRALAACASAAASERAGASERVTAAAETFTVDHPEQALSRVLELELAVRGKNAARVAAALAGWPRAENAERDAGRDSHLAAALVYESAGDRDAAAREYAAALRLDSACEPAARALLAGVGGEGAAEILSSLAEVCVDNGLAALLLIEAALRRGTDDAPAHEALLHRAADAYPTLPLSHRLGELLARQRGDADALLRWIRARRDAAHDPIEQALDRVREALLVADNDMSLAGALIEQALAVRPQDLALHELYERLAGGKSSDRGHWREDLAENVEGPMAARLLLEAALEYERGGEAESAARAATAAAERGQSELAKVSADRLSAASSSAARLAERLLERARGETDLVAQRELYERLSVLDRARGDHSSALLWQTAILEGTPGHLPALRRLEHAYIGSGRDEELEPVASALARRLDENEASAHAMLAARLRAEAGSWTAAREMVEIAARTKAPSLAALRALSTHARAAADDATSFEIDKRLSEQSTRALDGATLALRAAEAAARLGRNDDARALLDRAIGLVPNHLVALTTRAEVLATIGDHAAAAATLETAAAASSVPGHKLRSLEQAAQLWLDKVDDKKRGMAALEQAAEIDVTHGDVFARLQAVYVAQNERAKLAHLLEQRLERTQNAEERIQLEVTRGRALAEVGERDAAKLALAAALDANPDHTDALEAFADLCFAEGDFDGAEQSWIRLVRLVTDPARQAAIYRRLGDLYDVQLPNPQRAELAYKEVLKREPDDVASNEKLVLAYGRLGEVARAVELQTELVNRATTAPQKRDRTIALANVYETIAKDKRKAEATLDKARKAYGNDSALLRAMAKFHQRHGETTAVNVLLDRSAADARRALATGRFDASFFETLATIAELRGDVDTAAVAEATLGAIEGRGLTVAGAGAKAGDPALDELLAPELLSLPLRALLRKAGEALDAAYPVDLRTLRAAPLPSSAGEFLGLVRQLAGSFGVQAPDVYASPTLGAVCLPASSAPATLVFGQALLDSSDEASRYFLVVRALKVLQGRAAALSRTAPIDLWPVLAAFLGAFAPNWQPESVDPRRLNDAKQRIASALPKRLDNDVPVLALEVVGSIGNRASQLATAISEWGNRAGLLAIGDPSGAIRAVAMAGGHAQAVPASGAERLKWIGRNAEARDVCVFGVSEQYAEARRRAGVNRS